MHARLYECQYKGWCLVKPPLHVGALVAMMQSSILHSTIEAMNTES
jgi:hypothetical protein